MKIQRVLEIANESETDKHREIHWQKYRKTEKPTDKMVSVSTLPPDAKLVSGIEI